MARPEARSLKEITLGVRGQLRDVALISGAVVFLAGASIDMVRQRRTRLTRAEKVVATDKAAAQRAASHGSAAKALDTGGGELPVDHEVLHVLTDTSHVPKKQQGSRILTARPSGQQKE